MTKKYDGSQGTICERCNKPMNLAVEDTGIYQHSITEHDFYHWGCVEKDKDLRGNLKRLNAEKPATNS